VTRAAGDDRLLARVDARLWFGVLAGPIAWLVDMQASYLLVQPACRHGVRWPLHLATLVVLALPVAGALAALRARRDASQPGAIAATVVDRARFMSAAALGMCALFGLLLLALALTKVIHSPCD
jgi:hypothetical protein